MQNRISPNIIRQIFILLLICSFAVMIFVELVPYLSGILGAITFFVLLQKPMKYLLKRGWKPSIAATLLLILSFIGILIPITVTVLLLGSRVEKAIAKSEDFVKTIKEQVFTWEHELGYQFTSKIDASSLSGWLSNNVPDFLGSTFNMIIAIGIMYVMLYFMLSHRKALQRAMLDYIPISNDNLRIIGKDSLAMVKSNAIGIPLVAFAQGIVALIGFFIFNIEDPFFWAVIVFVGSMIPFVGTLLGTLPVFALTLINGNDTQAWGILIYGLVVISSTDNLLRLFILKRLDDVHPLITLFGVLVGVPLFGFIGLVFGPLLISLFLLVLRIYKEKYGKESSNTEGTRL
ncbi:AI-2E family transporter [Formosa sediminum]|uniref:AI-2E family transporter n=1 Tax=Formosa sediminum TaxID=2594004 RepID=A0A516GM86_9FLAO|nr:AI-2E family transporter [Formosa sediminum]QDO92628.1 AI-2E family transporter [Formosa sediminum]